MALLWLYHSIITYDPTEVCVCLHLPLVDINLEPVSLHSSCSMVHEAKQATFHCKKNVCG